VLRNPDHARWVFYVLIIGFLLAKIRPWRVLAAVLGGLVAFGLVVHAIVGAVWPRGTAGPISGLPGSLHFEPGGETQSFRPGRRRRRRGGGAGTGEHIPSAEGGSSAPPARVELPPAATG